MPTPFASRRKAPTKWATAGTPEPTRLNPQWRCTCCGKLLGVCREGRMHLRFTRGHEYHVGFPVQGTCRDCGTLNSLARPTD